MIGSRAQVQSLNGSRWEIIDLVGGFPGTWLDYFPIYEGNVIIPIDFPIFQRDWYTTNQLIIEALTCFGYLMDSWTLRPRGQLKILRQSSNCELERVSMEWY